MARTSQETARGTVDGSIERARGVLQLAVGTRIREMRENRNVGQRECARLAGVDSSSMFRIEKGQQNVSVELLARIALVLGVEMDELLVGIRPDPGLLRSGPSDQPV